MAQTLHQRQKSYEQAYNQTIIAKIPVIIKLDARSFARISSKAEKPFDQKIMSLFGQTMLNVIKQIEGAVFGFQYSDKIFIVLKNDQAYETEPWFGNNIQQIVSISAAMATYEFNSLLWNIEDPPAISEPVLFSSYVFGTPTPTECINYIIYQQLRSIQESINETANHSLKDKYGSKLPEVLKNKDLEERKILLHEDANIDMDDFPKAFTNGIASYLIPSIIKNGKDEIIKHKWTLNVNLPILSDHRDFIKTIITTGSDIFRPY